MPIESEEEVLELIKRGWSLFKDRYGFKLYDPQTKKFVRISNNLRDFCERLYQKMFGASETEEQKKRQVKNKSEPSAQMPSSKDVQQALEDDVKLIVTTIRQRIDPKAPILTKWVESLSWWHHLIINLSTYLLPDLLSLLQRDEIDMTNPDVTAKRIVSKYYSIREEVAKVEEIKQQIASVEQKYSSEMEALRQKLSALEELLRQYSEVIREQNKIIDELTDKAKRTMYLFLVEMPMYLPDNVRPRYKAVAGKIEEIWGEKR
jgi:DNA repair exonuclease SbcCD ATPase subunit